MVVVLRGRAVKAFWDEVFALTGAGACPDNPMRMHALAAVRLVDVSGRRGSDGGSTVHEVDGDTVIVEREILDGEEVIRITVQPGGA